VDSTLERHAEALKAMADAGLDILIILFGESTEPFQYNDKMRVVLHESNGRVIGTADNLFTLTIDHEQLLTANIEGNVYASYTHGSHYGALWRAD
jgi:hypothetical protein